MVKKNYIKVNDLYQANASNIYAVGDVIGWPSLAATSIIQGRMAALNALKKRTDGFPKVFPVGIYTIPEISYVGISKELTQDWEVGLGATYDFSDNDSSAFLTFSYKFGSGSSSNITTSAKNALNDKFNDRYEAPTAPADTKPEPPH